jgi:hypothetical protein
MNHSLRLNKEKGERTKVKAEWGLRREGPSVFDGLEGEDKKAKITDARGKDPFQIRGPGVRGASQSP